MSGHRTKPWDQRRALRRVQNAPLSCPRLCVCLGPVLRARDRGLTMQQPLPVPPPAPLTEPPRVSVRTTSLPGCEPGEDAVLPLTARPDCVKSLPIRRLSQAQEKVRTIVSSLNGFRGVAQLNPEGGPLDSAEPLYQLNEPSSRGEGTSIHNLVPRARHLCVFRAADGRASDRDHRAYRVSSSKLISSGANR